MIQGIVILFFGLLFGALSLTGLVIESEREDTDI